MDQDAALSRLRTLIRIPTVSRSSATDVDAAAFAHFRSTLAELYPLVHTQLEQELVGESLLFRWAGRGTADPAVLMAHYDVVPADEPGWQHPAFGAELIGDHDERRIWGRGTLDDKGALAAILEAVEAALAEGFIPANDVFLSFGGDEEVMGAGAEAIVARLIERGIRPGLVLDEGGAVVENVFPGVRGPVAVIGVSEKGVAGIELVVEKTGGHASTPARGGATSVLARAILRLERRPSRAAISAPTFEMIRTLGAHASAPLRFIFTRAGFFRPLLTAGFSRLGAETSAMVRTTRAVTRLSGSAGDNVIAERATAMVNVRIAVGSSVDDAARDIRRAIDDPTVDVRVVYGSEPSPVSPSSGPAWEVLTRTIADVFPGTIVTPYVMLQASDSRHFTRISDTVYRFLPFDLTLAERATLHAIDESMRVTTYLRGIEFFARLLRAL